jgi:hypothetical protein
MTDVISLYFISFSVKCKAQNLNIILLQESKKIYTKNSMPIKENIIVLDSIVSLSIRKYVYKPHVFAQEIYQF